MTTCAAVPRLSIVIAAYRSERTVGATLTALAAQAGHHAEVIVVDSSPDDRTAAEVRRFPTVTLIRPPEPMTPHAARNLGSRRARGSILVFTDADIIPSSTWLERLVATHASTGGVVAGAIACHGRRYFDNAIHLVKFSRFLPGGAPRPIDVGPTGNLLVPRRVFDAVGGFPDGWLGDVEFSRSARAAGFDLRFQPDATVEHWHVQTLTRFLAERYCRGVLYGELRQRWTGGGRGWTLLLLLATVLPIRLARILALTAGQCRRAGCLGWYLPALPVLVLGHGASLLGESAAYARAITHFSANAQTPVKTASP